MFTALVECLNWQIPNGLNVQDVNSGSMLTHAFKSNQSTLILSVTGFAHSVSKLSSVVFVAIFRCTYTILSQNTFNHWFCTLCCKYHACLFLYANLLNFLWGEWVPKYPIHVHLGVFHNILASLTTY